MRTGKIARLSDNIRDQINQRLQDGQPGKTIIKWLNSLDEVKAVLKAEFKGHAVIPSNLTEWKQGGYLDWLVRKDALKLAASLRDESALGDKALTEQFTRKLAQWVAVQYAASAQALIAAETDPQIKWARLRHLCADVCRLRRGDLLAERLEIERDRLALDKSNTAAAQEKLFWAWTNRPEIHEKLHPEEKPGISPETLALIDDYLMEGFSPLNPNEALNAKTWGRYASRPPKGFDPETGKVTLPNLKSKTHPAEVPASASPPSSDTPPSQ